jgi:predicted lactoylglutathione lyase
MNTKIFLNLPVADLSRSLAFFKALGYAPNPQFAGEGCACIIISDEIHVMVMTHAKFLEFSPKGICDTAKFNEVLFCLTCESRQKVDELVAKAIAAGGSTFEAAEDHGFMYSHSFIDPDGHGWGLVHMNQSPA